MIREMVAQVQVAVRPWEDRLLTERFSPYGVAVCRMLAGIVYIGLLLTNFGHRSILFGPGSDWVDGYREVSPEGAWLVGLDNLPMPLYTLVYLAVIGIGVAFVLGWHSRASGVLLLVGAVQLLESNPLVGDQGDNILRIGLFLILLTDHSAVWSLDSARDRRRRDAGESPRWLPPWHGDPRARMVGTILHNGALAALVLQLVIVYVAAAMFKIGGNGWKFGTAISYPLRLDEYRVWPFLNDFLVSTSVVVWFMTYLAIFVQLYFPVLLINRVTRRIALVTVLGLHGGIAVLMGLPWFSLAMVAFDSVFVSTATYLALERWVVPRWRRGREAVLRRSGLAR